MTDNHVLITLPSNGRWVHFIHDVMRRYGEMVGFSHKQEEMFTSSVMEACEELIRLAEKEAVSDPISLRLDFKGEAVIVDLAYSNRIPLNPHQTEDYEVPDGEADLDDLDDLNMDTLWLHMIKRRMDRVHFSVKGSRHVLRMIKYRRDAGKEKQAWVMAIRPKLRKGLVLHLDELNVETPSSLLQFTGKGVLKLGPSETYIVRNMDGEKSFHDLYMAHIDTLGLISPNMLAGLYEQLERMGMLADSEGAMKENRLTRIAKRCFNPDFSISKADALVETVHRHCSFFFNSLGLSILLAIGVSGVLPLWKHLERFREVVVGLEDRFVAEPVLLLPLYFLILLHVVLHELGHGVTCKHYGGKIPRMGIMFYLASFIFYCDTTAAWNFPEKRHRILVSLSGPIISFAIFGMGLWAAGHYAGTDSPWEPVFVCFSLFNFFGLVMNLNPFIKMDAYYMLLDYTGIVNLRHRSFKFMERKTLGWLGMGEDKDVNVTLRERKIFWWYGILGSGATVLLLGFPLLRLFHHLQADSSSNGQLFFLLLFVGLMVIHLGKVAFSKVKLLRSREYKIQ